MIAISFQSEPSMMSFDTLDLTCVWFIADGGSINCAYICIPFKAIRANG